MRSRCQTFVFPRPRLPELVTLLRRVADGEGIEAPDAALSLIARARARLVPRRGLDARPARRRDERTRSTCSPCSSSSARSRRRRCSGSATWSSTATRPARSLFVEELAEQGQDLGRLVTDLLEHLRHLLLVQHMGEVPDSLPVTEETRERLREQANQLGEPTVLRLIDLLAVAVDDMRQGGDPRLPLELALVKVTRPARRPLARVARPPARAARGARAERRDARRRQPRPPSRRREPERSPAAAPR